MLVIIRLFPVLAILFLTLTSAQAQSPVQRANLEADIENFEQQIADLELFAEMKDAAHYIPEESRCMTYLELASGYRDELAALNQQYDGRADATYRERAETLMDYNNRAIEEYQSCFGSVAAQRYQKIRDAFVYPYDTFRGRYNELSDWFGENANLEALLGELQRNLDEAKSQLQEMEELGDFVGTITHVFGEVRIERGTDTLEATRKTRLFQNDIVVTGARSRTRIELNDRDEQRQAGPTVLNIGFLSRVKMTNFNANTPRQRGLVDLIRGTIRVFTYGFGGRAAFSVRYGGSICGIRGTEVQIEYNDRTGESKNWLLHGTADVTTGSITRDLRPMHVLEISEDGGVTERQFTENEYASVGGIVEVAPVQQEQLAGTRFRANYHLNRYLNAFVNRDYLVASTYFVGEEKNEIQALLNKPDELRAYLADKTLPLAWQLGCLTCTAEVECAATLALNLSNTPDQINYYEWTIRPDGNLWIPVRIVDIDKEFFNNSKLTCPAPN